MHRTRIRSRFSALFNFKLNALVFVLGLTPESGESKRPIEVYIMYSTNAFKKVIFYMDTNGHMTLTFFFVLLCVVAITFCAQARLSILPASDVFDKTCLPQAHNSFLQDIEVYLFMRRQEKCFQTAPNSQAFLSFVVTKQG